MGAVLVSLLLTLNKFHVLLGVSIVDFEQVNVSWVCEICSTLHSRTRSGVFIIEFEYIRLINLLSVFTDSSKEGIKIIKKKGLTFLYITHTGI